MQIVHFYSVGFKFNDLKCCFFRVVADFNVMDFIYYVMSSIFIRIDLLNILLSLQNA